MRARVDRTLSIVVAIKNLCGVSLERKSLEGAMDCCLNDDNLSVNGNLYSASSRSLLRGVLKSISNWLFS